MQNIGRYKTGNFSRGGHELVFLVALPLFALSLTLLACLHYTLSLSKNDT